MAKYTLELNDLIEANFDFGLKDYPIWDEAHREELNQKILDHYRFREIGFETPAKFKFYLNRTMNEIMPYYNKLYETTMYEYNPIHVADYTEEISRQVTSEGSNTTTSTGEGTTSGTSSGTSTMNLDGTVSTDTNTKELSSDTPQNAISHDTIDDVTYASEIKFNKSGDQQTTASEQSNTSSQNDSSTSTGTTTSEGSDENTTSEEYSKRLFGNYGVITVQHLIEEERKLIVNIDLKIIYELNDLFMLIY